MSLGQFNLEGIPPAPRGVPQIEVTFDIDANGILNVSAKDKATGTEQAITITASTNLDQSEVEQMIRQAKQHEAEDRRHKELVEARNTADTAIYQVEKALRELGDKVSAGDRSTIERTIEDLKVAKEGNDAGRIKQLTEQLQQASYAMSQQMYAQQAAGQQAPGGPTQGGGPGPGPEDVVDGEFSEV
jgi:molecular chaperone DnaK